MQNPSPIEVIEADGVTLGIVVRAEYREPGLRFFTPDEFSQQLAFMRHPAGKVIDPHTHTPHERSVTVTQEVLFIRSGRLKVDFFTDDRRFVCTRTLGAGDAILLASGGHGFTVLEEVEMFEVKQGPFAGDDDKVRFEHPGCDDAGA